MNVDNVNAFTEVIVSTFETSCGAPPFRNGQFEKREGPVTNPGELMCVMEFAGTLTGVALMTFPAETANKIYGSMMMETISEFNEEVAEGFSEILNMVIGNVKAQLTEQKIEFEKPQAIVGQGEVYDKNKDIPWLYIPMKFKEYGAMELYIAVKK